MPTAEIKVSSNSLAHKEPEDGGITAVAENVNADYVLIDGIKKIFSCEKELMETPCKRPKVDLQSLPTRAYLDPDLTGIELVPLFCAFLGVSSGCFIWATILFEIWKRRCTVLAYRWGTITESFKQARAEYKGVLGINKVAGRLEPHYPKKAKPVPTSKKKHSKQFVMPPEATPSFKSALEVEPGKSLVCEYGLGMMTGSRPGDVVPIGIRFQKSLLLTPDFEAKKCDRVLFVLFGPHRVVAKARLGIDVTSTMQRFKDLEREMRLTVVGKCEIKDLPFMLYVPLLTPCLGSEKISVTVNLIRGCFLVSLAQRELPLTREIEDCLNSDKRDLKKLLTNLRYCVMLERCHQSLQQMPVECYDELPFVKLYGHHLEDLRKYCLYISLPLRLSYYLVVEVVMPVEKGLKKLSYNYYVQAEGIEAEGAAAASLADEGTSGGFHAVDRTDLPQLFLRPSQILKRDPFALIRGQCGKVVSFESEDSSHLSRKRKLLMGNQWDVESAKSKRSHESTYFVSELTHFIVLCKDKLSFVALDGELTKREISHMGAFVDSEGTSLALSLLKGLPCAGISKKVEELLKSNLLLSTFRIQSKEKAIWCVKSFLSLFVDESNTANQVRRRMTADDDNPLSPVVTDSMDSFLASLSNPPSVARNMIIAPSPSNMMAPSPGNPALLVPSSPSSFIPVPSPGSLGMHLPSPGAAAFMPGSSGMVDSSGSPYPGSSGLVMPSPPARTWPGLPIVHVSPASRMGMAPSPGHPSLQASPSQHKDVDHSTKLGECFLNDLGRPSFLRFCPTTPSTSES